MNQKKIENLKGEVFSVKANELEQIGVKIFFSKIDILSSSFVVVDGDLKIKSCIDGFQWSDKAPDIIRDLSHTIKNISEMINKIINGCRLHLV